MTLSEKQKKHLRRLGHPLNPVVMLGNAGLTPGVVKELDRALADHELVKVSARVGERSARDAALEIWPSRPPAKSCSASAMSASSTAAARRCPRFFCPTPEQNFAKTRQRARVRRGQVGIRRLDQHRLLRRQVMRGFHAARQIVGGSLGNVRARPCLELIQRQRIPIDGRRLLRDHQRPNLARYRLQQLILDWRCRCPRKAADVRAPTQ